MQLTRFLLFNPLFSKPFMKVQLNSFWSLYVKLGMELKKCRNEKSPDFGVSKYESHVDKLRYCLIYVQIQIFIKISYCG